MADGKNIALICKDLHINVQTYDRRRMEYAGLKRTQSKRLEELTRENGKPENDRKETGRRRNDLRGI